MAEYVKLRIGGYPICGAVGDGASITIPVQDCWDIYTKWVRSLAEGPVTVLDNVKWTVNGTEYDRPKAWSITIGLEGENDGDN